MGVSWTKEQQLVINTRDCSLLVAAAAGSGKTAVLVERIIEMICDSTRPVDVDRLLVVTFTNAAAGEMRERVQRAIEKRLEEEPDNLHLRRQEILVGHANITTIDSFCLSVLREHFQEIDLDPAFRVADEGELKLLQQDVLAKLLEQEYGNPSESFLNFMEAYASGKNDASAAEEILRLYGYAMANPRPEDWLEYCLEAYQVSSFEELENASWMKQLLESVVSMVADCAAHYEKPIALCTEVDGPAGWEALLKTEQESLKLVLQQQGYQAIQQAISAVSFAAKPRKKKSDQYSDEAAANIWGIREKLKKQVEALQKEYFQDTPEEILEKHLAAGTLVRELVRLTRAFYLRFQAAKRQRKLIDFSDMEHFALEILSQKTEQGEVPTPTALQYRDSFEEILIDEYQDSNYVQELILTSIARQDPPNLFMVGDVKQSIYRFRQARPELFMEKYESFSSQEGSHRKIELHSNFRSRANVLDTVNFMFYQLMQKSVGNVAYTREAALYPGLEFAACPEHPTGGSTEILLLDLEDTPEEAAPAGEGGASDAVMPAPDTAPEQVQYSSREWEAVMIGKKIREITDPETGLYIWDSRLSAYRLTEYRDIAILLRTVNGWADEMVPILLSMGIPAAAQSGDGYFSAAEVQVTLSLLEVIDNPLQDIPLTAVLRSAIGGFSDGELAQIRGVVPKGETVYFYQALQKYAVSWETEALGIRVNAFLRRLEHYRRSSQIMTVSELLRYVLQDSGYYDYVCAMPGAVGRTANLDMLMTRAEAFEKTSYQGVFQFVRYINLLKKYEVDYQLEQGESAQNQVSLMSIHKSKGLEFPVCFVAGTGKSFNRRDLNAPVLLSMEHGIGTDVIDPIQRTKEKTLMKHAIRNNGMLENLGEELRVLYVAVTRAREKLYITGAKNDVTAYLKQQIEASEIHRKELPYQTLVSAGCFLDWIMAATVKHRMITPFCQQEGLNTPFTGVCYHDPCEISLELCSRQELLQGLVVHRVEDAVKEAVLEALAEQDAQAQGGSRNLQIPEIEKRLEYRYRYDDLCDLHAAFSVSELKRLHYQEEEAQSVKQLFSGPAVTEKLLPEFLQETKRMTAAARGTLYHLVFEHLNFTQPVEQQLLQLKDSGLLGETECSELNVKSFRDFLNSPIGQRAAQAEKEGMYHREYPFILGVPASELIQGTQQPRVTEAQIHPEYVSIQGVIDAWFEEADGIVLVDFKTDRKPASMPEEQFGQELCSRYQIQLQYYRRALEQMTGKQVKECFLYSVSMGKEVACFA